MGIWLKQLPDSHLQERRNYKKDENKRLPNKGAIGYRFVSRSDDGMWNRIR